MRILVDYRPALRARTGVGEYIWQIVRAYTAVHRDEVTVFTSSWKDRPPPATAAELAVRVVDRRVPVKLLNLLWHRLEWPPIESLAGEADVVHAAHPLLIPSRRAAHVVTIHDLFFLDNPERTQAEIKRDYAALAGAHARRADAVITSSLHTRRLINQRLGVELERIYCCPPGAPTWTAIGRGPNVPRDGYILFLGTLEPRKNIGFLLDVFERLIASGPRPNGALPRLRMAGGASPEAREWIDRLSRPPLAAHVEYLGYTPHDDRERLYAGARALVFPSLDEGFGLPALEAMSAGVPVIASNRGALPEIVAGGGTLLDPLDRDAWVNAIARALDDDGWATAQGCAGLERAKAFTWPATVARLREAYVDAIGRRSRR
jgi:glycosyltransferase involved in cell wall biosynthesis